MGNGRNQVEVVEGVELHTQITESSSYKLYIIITLLTDIYKYLSIVEQFNIYICIYSRNSVWKQNDASDTLHITVNRS